MYAAVIGALTLVSCSAQLLGHGENPRIIGGYLAKIEDFPYHVLVIKSGRFQCGGAIISSNYVVTAGHCTDRTNPDQLRIRAGTEFFYAGGQVIQVKKVFMHPKYDDITWNFDISVVELVAHFDLNAKVQPVKLPKLNQHIEDGIDAVVSGWGRIRADHGQTQLSLRAVTIQIVSDEKCRLTNPDVTDSTICAGVAEGGKDVCEGDSGGPLVVDGELVGVVSWAYRCAYPNNPRIYTSIPKNRDFISKVTGL